MTEEHLASITEFCKGKVIKDVKVLGIPSMKDDRFKTDFAGKGLRIDFLQGSCILIDNYGHAEFLTIPEAKKRAV